MKNINRIVICCCMFICLLNHAYAQNTKRAVREAKKMAEVKAMIDTGRYIFTANFVTPMRMAARALTSGYELKITRDTLVAYLPYFGQAYVAPMDPSQGGINFTSTKFSFVPTRQQKGGWLMQIKPKDTKDVRQMFLTISNDGYATLQISSLNRDPITFDGIIERIGK